MSWCRGAECIRDQVIHHGRRRIALVAPTAADARDVMVEGESGLLAIGPPQQRPQYEPTKRRLTWPNGAIATTYSADEPERLRGPQHDAAWCDEIASWRYPEAWDMLMFGLRLGPDPRVVVTTTPKPIKIIRELIADPTNAITRDSTYDNRANLELRDSASRGDVSDREPLIRVPLNLSHLQSVVRTWGMYPPARVSGRQTCRCFMEVACAVGSNMK